LNELLYPADSSGLGVIPWDGSLYLSRPGRLFRHEVVKAGLCSDGIVRSLFDATGQLNWKTKYAVEEDGDTVTGAPIADFRSTTMDIRDYLDVVCAILITGYNAGGGADLEMYPEYGVDGTNFEQGATSTTITGTTGSGEAIIFPLTDEMRRCGYFRWFFDCNSHTTVEYELAYFLKR